MKKMTNSKRMELILARLLNYWETEDPRRVGGLTESQLSLLLSLSEHPGCRVQDTAERLDLTAPTISIGVRRLEKMGLVQRNADPDDSALCACICRRRVGKLLPRHVLCVQPSWRRCSPRWQWMSRSRSSRCWRGRFQMLIEGTLL